MPNTQPVYHSDDSHCTAPVTSDEYQHWLWSLPVFLRETVIEDLTQRGESKKHPSVHQMNGSPTPIGSTTAESCIFPLNSRLEAPVGSGRLLGDSPNIELHGNYESEGDRNVAGHLGRRSR
jgi:hypothetical protein